MNTIQRNLWEKTLKSNELEMVYLLKLEIKVNNYEEFFKLVGEFYDEVIKDDEELDIKMLRCMKMI